jgi:hypothetical protein
MLLGALLGALLDVTVVLVVLEGAVEPVFVPGLSHAARASAARTAEARIVDFMGSPYCVPFRMDLGAGDSLRRGGGHGPGVRVPSGPWGMPMRVYII